MSFLHVHGLLIIILTEHPYEKRLTKTDWSYCAQFEGKQDLLLEHCIVFSILCMDSWILCS